MSLNTCLVNKRKSTADRAVKSHSLQGSTTLPYSFCYWLKSNLLIADPSKSTVAVGATCSLSPAKSWAPLLRAEGFPFMLKLHLMFYSQNSQNRVPNFKNSVFFPVVSPNKII